MNVKSKNKRYKNLFEHQLDDVDDFEEKETRNYSRICMRYPFYTFFYFLFKFLSNLLLM